MVVEYYDQKLNARVTERLMILGNEKILGKFIEHRYRLVSPNHCLPHPCPLPLPSKKSNNAKTLNKISC